MGTLEPGRAEHDLGTHVAGQNTGKLGICWAGGLERGSSPGVGVNNMTAVQEQRLIRLIRDLLKRYPGARVVGHRDLAATQCPGFDVVSWWAAVERAAAAPSVPVVTAPVTPSGWFARICRPSFTALGR